MKANHWSYSLKFRHPFTISKGTKTHQPTLIVELESMGIKGYGEAPAITYYHITVEQMALDLANKKAFIEKFAFTEPDRYWHYLHHLIPDDPFLVCALDIAAWDIYGQLKNKRLDELWKHKLQPAHSDPAQYPMTDYTIGIDPIDKMVSFSRRLKRNKTCPE